MSGVPSLIQATSVGSANGHDEGYHLLLVEDDPADALLVTEMLDQVGDHYEVSWAKTMAEALTLLAANDPDCVLLDLGLPDGLGLESLKALLVVAPDVATVVLTGLSDERQGQAALAVGAQDYLVKGQVESLGLSRSIRFSIERKRAEIATKRLHEADIRRVENLRLERGLLPKPLVHDPRITWRSAYQPGANRSLLGGDFLDLVELPDGSVRAVIGDVCGHGPDEAALGVSLRIAWRTLVLAGTPTHQVLPGVERVLASERHLPDLFTTVADIVVDADRSHLRLRLAGHPEPFIDVGDGWSAIRVTGREPPLGVGTGRVWSVTSVPLPPTWRLLLFTDGIIDAPVGTGSERLGIEGLEETLRRLEREPASPPGVGASGGHLVERLIASVRSGSAPPLSDDVAILSLQHES